MEFFGVIPAGLTALDNPFNKRRCVSSFKEEASSSLSSETSWLKKSLNLPLVEDSPISRDVSSNFLIGVIPAGLASLSNIFSFWLNGSSDADSERDRGTPFHSSVASSGPIKTLLPKSIVGRIVSSVCTPHDTML